MDSSLPRTASLHVDHLAAPYLRLDETGVIQHANSAAAALLNWHTPHLRGKRFEQFLSPSSHGSLTVLLRQALESGPPAAG